MSHTAALDASEREASPIAPPMSSGSELASSETTRALDESANGRRRVLGIMYQFPPAREIGAQSCSQISRYLPAYGWDVTVLTVQEKYIPGAADQYLREGFPGTVIRTGVIPHPLSIYRRIKAGFKSEPEDLPQATAQRDNTEEKAGGALRKWLLSMLFVPDRYTGWILPAVIGGLGAIRRQRVDCLFSSGPWWSNHLVGLALAELTGLPWITHFRDPWTQAEWLKPVSNMSIRLDKALERRVVTKAHAVVSVGEMQTALMQQDYPDLPADKFITIFNGYDGGEWEALFEGKTEAPRNEKFTITYAGSFYFRRSPLPLFRALQSLIESGEVSREDLELELLGRCDVADGVRVEELVAMCGLTDCVTNIGFVCSRPETLRRMARSNLLLLSVDQAYQIPAKTYEYLRSGRPILALTSGGEIVDLLNKTGGAWIADPADIDAIKAAVLEAYRSWRSGVDGRSPNREVVEEFDRRRLAGRFAKLLEASLAAEARV